MQKTKLFTIDLTKIGGKGAIKCPTCRNKISPEDQTEEAYTIVRPVMKKDSLDGLVLQCNRCGSHINLTGFRFLDRMK